MTIAEAATGMSDWLTSIPLTGIGSGLGACLMWFMFRAENRLRAVEHAIGLMARAMVLAVASNSTTGENAKELAKALLEEIEEHRKTKT